MLLGILIGVVIAGMAVAIFSPPKSKMDYSPAHKWGSLMGPPRTVKRSQIKLTRDEQQKVYRSADDASWRDQEEESVIIEPSVAGVIPVDCRKTLDYRQLSSQEQRELYDVLIESKVSPPAIPKKKFDPGKRMIFNPSDTIVDTEPFAVQHWNKHINVISSCDSPEAMAVSGVVYDTPKR